MSFEERFIFLLGSNKTISALLPFFRLPALRFKRFAGFVLISSTSFNRPKFFSLITVQKNFSYFN